MATSKRVMKIATKELKNKKLSKEQKIVAQDVMQKGKRKKK